MPPLLKTTSKWTSFSSPPPLLSGEVHVWRVVVPGVDRTPPHWLGLLTAEEQARAAGKRIPLDARRTLTSRACLRLLLGSYLDVPPASVAFTANATSKPQIATPFAASPLEFNVSHSGDWVVLAFARGLPLGIDVEEHRELEFSEIVNAFFSPPEREIWSTVPLPDHTSAFFSAWTRKEAYLKALGLGLFKALDSFSVAFGPDPSSGLVWCASDASAPQRWRIASIDLAPSYSCALAVGSAASALQTFTFDPRSTLGGSRSSRPTPSDLPV